MKCDLLFSCPIFVEEYDLDNTDIICYARNRAAYEGGVQKSNMGGYQSADNFFNARVCLPLLQKINNSLNIIEQNLKISTPLFVDGAWVNINKKHDYNAVHVHPRSYLSGVYYLQANPNSGNIMFHTPLMAKQVLDPPFSEEIVNVTANTVIYESKPGRCLIFPAWLEHSVQQSKSDEDRISISFNVFYKI